MADASQAPSRAYRLGRLIGRGSFGRVYEATSTDAAGVEERVAVKLVSKRLLRNRPDLRARLVREVEVHTQVSEPLHSARPLHLPCRSAFAPRKQPRRSPSARPPPIHC